MCPDSVGPTMDQLVSSGLVYFHPSLVSPPKIRNMLWLGRSDLEAPSSLLSVAFPRWAVEVLRGRGKTGVGLGKCSAEGSWLAWVSFFGGQASPPSSLLLDTYSRRPELGVEDPLA